LNWETIHNNILLLLLFFILAQVGIFYTGLYLSLIAMFGVVLWVFFQTLDPRTPTRQLEHSLIGTNPGTYLYYNRLFIFKLKMKRLTYILFVMLS
jgi:predicted membrane metal-binding protein